MSHFLKKSLLSGSGRKDVKEVTAYKDLSMTDRYAHLTNMRTLSRQKDLARFHANCEGMKVQRTTQKPHKSAK
jgi:hypothetical protein